MTQRIYNFNAGPAALPLPVLEHIQEEMLDFRGSGMSILEVSHRSKWFEDVLDDTTARIKRLLKLDDRYHVLFLQGGASMQFCMVPMNLAVAGKPVDYVDTGTWSTKAIKEARIQGLDVRVVASSQEKEFTYIPKEVPADGKAAYLHLTSNNTIRGTQWRLFPDSAGIPIVCDMSSDIFSRIFDPAPFGLIYAGAQKNAGPAGVTLVIVRDDMLERVPATLPTMLKYTTYVEKKSMFNTPPTFAIYVMGLVTQWIEETVGGIEKMEGVNNRKAALLYDYLDSQNFYRGTAMPDSRSFMNVTFRLPTEELEQKFIKESLASGLGGLKGHRSVGGCRASIYNAVPTEAVQALVDFMKEFARKNG
ncbi:MAG: 3-phosphoserine/phosphohydroxythreonine transaminase [Deltaproteobacteria bacterium]|jgi:phosphoserine aminotransferase|nr:3-phosphoserine/phosphohydroxythreonine transaminase [Deltaproteobacteria bacterium]